MAVGLAIMICAAIAMMIINIFSLGFSSVSLMLLAGVISLMLFALQSRSGKAGEKS